MAGDGLQAAALGQADDLRIGGGEDVGCGRELHRRRRADGQALGALPALVMLPAGSWDSPLIGLLAEEIARDEPGQQAVLARQPGATLLRQPGATIGGVAHKVGYASPYALSTAFKRVRGISPRAHRRATA